MRARWRTAGRGKGPPGRGSFGQRRSCRQPSSRSGRPARWTARCSPSPVATTCGRLRIRQRGARVSPTTRPAHCQRVLQQAALPARQKRATDLLDLVRVIEVRHGWQGGRVGDVSAREARSDEVVGHHLRRGHRGRGGCDGGGEGRRGEE